MKNHNKYRNSVTRKQSRAGIKRCYIRNLNQYCLVQLKEPMKTVSAKAGMEGISERAGTGGSGGW